MLKRRVRIGINGFGRIGRCVLRILQDAPDFEVVAVNDLLDNVDNLLYLYNYDSTYGPAQERASVALEGRGGKVGSSTIRFYASPRADQVSWEDRGTDILVDATGVAENVDCDIALIRSNRIRKAIVTHAPENGVDRHVIMGVNDEAYDPAGDHVVSASICDSNAIAHPLHAIERRFGIENGFVTTLHPWLSYQNLVDGPVPWQRRPGSFWGDLALGRSSIGTLIPKTTTAVTALRPVMPEIEGRLAGLSFRVPTQIVSTADLTIRLRETTTVAEVQEFFAEHYRGSPYVRLNAEPLVGLDYRESPYSATIDLQWLNVLDGRLLKLVLWYDNEFGYSSRVVDLARLMARDF